MKRLKKKDLLLLAKKLIEKMSHPHNAEKNDHSLIRKKTQKISKAIRNNYLSTNIFWKPKNC